MVAEGSPLSCAGDVAKADGAAVGGGLHHDLLEIGRVGEAAGDVHGVFVGDALLGGGSADAATRDLNVLLAHGVDDVAGGEAVGAELLRIEPEAHGELARAEDLGIADAGDTGDLVLDALVNEVA
jgi:hypothetical protein